MRLRLPLVVGALALALPVSACGDPVVPPDDVESWVGSATGLVRGKVLGLEEGPQSPGLATLRVDMQVISVYGDVDAAPGDTVHGTITIWNQPDEAAGWDAWG